MEKNLNGPIFMLSELTYEKVSEVIGSKHFNMHYDSSDALRSINSEDAFNYTKEEFMERFGDVKIQLNKSAYWFDVFYVLDDNWRNSNDEYCRLKGAWCDKYGAD